MIHSASSNLSTNQIFSPPQSSCNGHLSSENKTSIPNAVHPALQAGRVAVITGAAHGIGKAAAKELARIGLKIAIADVNEERLNSVGAELVDMIGKQNVLVIPTDVSKLNQVVRLKDRVYDAWGEVAVLMNNAGVREKASSWTGTEELRKVFEVNVLGMINVQHTFVPSMINQESRSVVINSGSKRGITNPPGDVVYSASKAAVKSLTESLAHELRETPGCKVTAHLFTAGNTWTGLTGDDGTGENTKLPAAWFPEETVLYMLNQVREGEFYILVPDNETTREMDKLRIMWSAGDIVEGRPALSRWHKDYVQAFEEFMQQGLAA